MLSELRAERQAVEEAIITLERLSLGRGRRRGRPPAWMVPSEEAWASARQQEQAEKLIKRARLFLGLQLSLIMSFMIRRWWRLSRSGCRIFYGIVKGSYPHGHTHSVYTQVFTPTKASYAVLQMETNCSDIQVDSAHSAAVL